MADNADSHTTELGKLRRRLNELRAECAALQAAMNGCQQAVDEAYEVPDDPDSLKKAQKNLNEAITAFAQTCRLRDTARNDYEKVQKL